MPISRREARIHLFELLFKISFNPEQALDPQIKEFFENLELLKELDDDDIKMPYSSKALTPEEEQELTLRAEDIVSKLPDIDRKIEELSSNWKLERMNKVDLNIIRLAAYEIIYDENIPERVSVNEAVEIAKIYGGEQSFSFVNGILGKFLTNGKD